MIALLASLIERTCPSCGSAFIAKIADVKRGRGIHCSRRCNSRTQARRNHARSPQTGEQNPNFKGWASRVPRRYVERFRTNHPDKAIAHDAVQLALRRGFLVKPSSCSECGTETAARDLHAHHEDYARPFDVRWTCRSCHHELDRARHARIAQQAVQEQMA